MALSAEHVEERWRALWEASPQRSPFSRLAYLRNVAGASGLQLSVHFVQDEGRDKAGAAVTWARRGPYRMVVVPPYTPFSAVLMQDDLSDSDVHAQSSPFGAVLREIERNYDAAFLHLHPSLEDVRPAIWRGWNAQPLYTYVFPIVESPDIFERWSSSAVRNYRGARDSYELVEGRAASSAAVRLSIDSYARHGRSGPLTLEKLEQVVEDSTSMSSAYAVRRRDEPSRIDAAIVTLTDAGRSYYWVAGSQPGNAMTVLVGELLSRINPLSVGQFDFVGANTPSIAEFKRRFGCSLEAYYRIVYYGRRDLELLYVLRNLFRR